MGAAWQTFVQPISIGMIGATAVGMGVAGVISRRRHMQELQEIETNGSNNGTHDAEEV